VRPGPWVHTDIPIKGLPELFSNVTRLLPSPSKYKSSTFVQEQPYLGESCYQLQLVHTHGGIPITSPFDKVVMAIFLPSKPLFSFLLPTKIFPVEEGGT
jgi:hypothetical protein